MADFRGALNFKVMKANLVKNEAGAKLPAGIIEGTEAFWYNNEKWLIHEGVSMLFIQAPTKIQNMVVEIFRKDNRSQHYLVSQGLVQFSEQFDRWYQCVIGALDETPDFINGNLNADAYNHSCTDYSCPLRGKLCSIATGLLNYEVETITVLKQGLTIDQAADELCISVSGLKSRIEKIREKLAAKNMAEMIAKAVRYRI